MEEVAEELGMDIVEFKKLNMLRQGGTTPTGQYLDAEVILEEVMDKVMAGKRFSG